MMSDKEFCPSCVWRGPVRLVDGVCPYCHVNWSELSQTTSADEIVEFYYCCNCIHGFLPHEMNIDYEGTAYCPCCGDEVSMSTEPIQMANELSAMWGW